MPSSTSCERLSCQTTIGDSGAAALGVPGQHRLALVVEPAGRHLTGRLGEQLANRLHHRGQHLFCVLLHPARLRVAVDLVAPRLAQRLEPLVEQRGLHAGGPLVDSEQ